MKSIKMFQLTSKSKEYEKIIMFSRKLDILAAANDMMPKYELLYINSQMFLHSAHTPCLKP